MLNNISFHIESDPDRQEQIEKESAKQIQTAHKNNINALQRHIPSLLPYATQTKSQNISIFCNRFGRFNIIDYGVGQVLYGFNPEHDARSQVEHFLQHGSYVPLAGQHSSTVETSGKPELCQVLPKLTEHLSRPAVPSKVECLVIMGVGLGHHIVELLQRCKPKYVVIYEPEPQYFSSSILVLDWREMLDFAQKHDIHLFIQVEKDGRDLLQDLEELRKAFPIEGFFLYKHYNHPIFDTVQSQIQGNRWQTLLKNGFQFGLNEDPNQFYPKFTSVNCLEKYRSINKKNDRFQRNINAFKKHFPDIAKEFSQYEPKLWLPVATPNGQINVVNKSNLICWYSDEPRQDCLDSLKAFSEHPNKDGLVLGYKGKKLAHYTHYQFVKETESLLEAVESEQGALPDEIQSMIMFGIGVGYQLEAMADEHSLEKVFICEPNHDFFYASLFAIEWDDIFNAIDEEKGKLYINIGDDGNNLFRDLLGQFYSIGPYILNNTYFYQGYYNASLNHAISRLREQLQVVISMGEYFDHAYHGIEHTKEALRRGLPNLRKDPYKQLSYDQKNVPVFIVGNGPSLDKSLPIIQEWQDNAIIVSCGTALQVLHRHGIVPDFHAEIEQNRATFDWACMIGDFDYLKQVSLISCNGIHPDTCDLYKDVFIAFKEGESSTVSTIQVIGESDYELLKYAFPTVVNFATDLFIKFGFQNMYFIGVDLGFVEDGQHHSKHSAYYTEEGEEMYDYAGEMNTSLVVPGNYRKTVFTKHEFKIAKTVLEQAISNASKGISFYNCSDGALISGASPLHVDQVLVTSSGEDKLTTISKIKNDSFLYLNGGDAVDSYEERYSAKVLANEMAAFTKWINHPVTSFSEAQRLIDMQKNLLFTSYKNGRSLLFYYLYGTVNFANAMLTKLLFSSKETGMNQFQKGLAIWRDYFEEIKSISLSGNDRFDRSMSPNNLLRRMYSMMKYRYDGKKIAVITNSTGYMEALNYFAETQLKLANAEMTFLNKHEFDKLSGNQRFDYVMYHFVDEFDKPKLDTPQAVADYMQLHGRCGTLYVDYHFDRDQLEQLHERCSGNLCVIRVFQDPRPLKQSEWLSDLGRTALASFAGAIETRYHIIFPKYPVLENLTTERFDLATRFDLHDSDAVYSHYRYICVDLAGQRDSAGIMATGDRGQLLQTGFSYKDLVSITLPAETYQEAPGRMQKIMPAVVQDSPLCELKQTKMH